MFVLLAVGRVLLAVVVRFRGSLLMCWGDRLKAVVRCGIRWLEMACGALLGCRLEIRAIVRLVQL